MSLEKLDNLIAYIDSTSLHIKTPANRPKVGIGCFIIHSNVDNINDVKILVGRRKKKSGYNKWALPGGHLEDTESWGYCASRETKEETNLYFNENQWKFTFVGNSIVCNGNKKLHYIVIFMSVIYDGKSKIINLEPNKCFGWEWKKWIELQKLDDNHIFGSLKSLLKMPGFNPLMAYNNDNNVCSYDMWQQK